MQWCYTSNSERIWPNEHGIRTYALDPWECQKWFRHCVFFCDHISSKEVQSTILMKDTMFWYIYIYIQIDTRHGGFHQVIIFICFMIYSLYIYIYLCLIHVGTPSPNSSGHYSCPTQVLFAIDPEQMLWPSRSLRHCTAICWRTLVLVTLGYQPV